MGAHRKVRLTIRLDPEMKYWLIHRARREQVSLAALVRRAIQQYCEEEGLKEHPSFDDLLRQTKGTWRQTDGLAYQEEMRNEWRNDTETDTDGDRR